jgi:hypothetical protein
VSLKGGPKEVDKPIRAIDDKKRHPYIGPPFQVTKNVSPWGRGFLSKVEAFR